MDILLSDLLTGKRLSDITKNLNDQSGNHSMYVRKIFTCVGFHGNHRPPPFTNPFPGPLFISDRGQRLMAGAHKTTSHVSDAGALRSQTFRIREHERVSPNKNDKSPPRSITKTSERHSFSSSIHPKACSGIHCTRGDTLSCDHC